MSAGKLEAALKSLGWTYFLGLCLQVRVDERNILLPLFAVWASYLLSRLRSHRMLSDTPGFTVAQVSAAIVAVAGFLSWVPPVEPGAMAVIVAIGIAAGSAGYAGALQRWCVVQGWTEPAAIARSAQRWMAATAVVIVVAVLALVVSVSPAHPDANSSFTPAVVFGRLVDGAGGVVGFVAILVVWIVATIRLRKASQLTRQELCEQRDAEPVAS